ncbi:cytoplasmic dynein with WD40 domain [Cichlidogyrus casuarinus]|uniref:Cytoplasmic dynein with WD40 domain n=1 Tax=Cichlidogyrus casuarinus TaxID=1844966 RepID=A0ABD2Q4L2_9PLAT
MMDESYQPSAEETQLSINGLARDESRESSLDKDTTMDSSGSMKIVKAHPGFGDRLRNSERGTQCKDTAQRQISLMTDPPPNRTFSHNVTQGVIFDAYQEDFESQQITKNDSRSNSFLNPKQICHQKKHRPNVLTGKLTKEQIASLVKAGLVIERMLCMNNYSEVVTDFKYYDDPSVGNASFSMNGTLLPLWKFRFSEVNKNHLSVTEIKFSTSYSDLFFASYGNEFADRKPLGLILGFSFKKSTMPDFLIRIDSCVLSIDICEERGHLLCAGMKDGSIAIYSLPKAKLVPGQNAQEAAFTEPLFRSFHNTDPFIGQHFAPCWQVRWLFIPEPSIDRETKKPSRDKRFLSLVSVGSDGRVLKWTLRKHELQMTQLCRVDWQMNEKEVEISKMMNQLNGSDAVVVEKATRQTLYDGICCFDVSCLRASSLGMDFQFDPLPSANLDLLSNFKAGGVKGILNMNDEANKQPSRKIEQVMPDAEAPQVAASSVMMDTKPTRKMLPYSKDDQSMILGLESGDLVLCKALELPTDPFEKYWRFERNEADGVSSGDAHQMPVYNVQWHPFVKDVFATCAADWLLKIWHIAHTEAKQTFELGAPVVDFSWCPYMGTVFAALLSDGNAVIYNLSVNKYKPIIKQMVVSTQNANQPTHIRFNSSLPVLLVGDAKGIVTSLKLPPNVRPQKDPNDKQKKIQIEITPSLIEEEERKLLVALGLRDPNDYL